jgi:hypothetical protein
MPPQCHECHVSVPVPASFGRHPIGTYIYILRIRAAAGAAAAGAAGRATAQPYPEASFGGRAARAWACRGKPAPPCRGAGDPDPDAPDPVRIDRYRYHRITCDLGHGFVICDRNGHSAPIDRDLSNRGPFVAIHTNKMVNRTYDIVVMGATGFSGKLLAVSLASWFRMLLTSCP